MTEPARKELYDAYEILRQQSSTEAGRDLFNRFASDAVRYVCETSVASATSSENPQIDGLRAVYRAAKANAGEDAKDLPETTEFLQGLAAVVASQMMHERAR